MFWDQNITALFAKTGFVGWPILLCSIIGIAIILERAYYFFRLRFDYSVFVHQLFALLKDNKIKEAKMLCRKHPNPIPRMAGVYLTNQNNKHREGILSREGSFAMEKVENRLRGLATIAHIAPLLGLLGTVAGLVNAFHQIELIGGNVRPEHLAGGIWEALLSTVFGLVVAIPCMAAYHAFESRTDHIARRIHAIVSQLDEFFGSGNGNNKST